MTHSITITLGDSQIANLEQYLKTNFSYIRVTDPVLLVQFLLQNEADNLTNYVSCKIKAADGYILDTVSDEQTSECIEWIGL